MSHADDVREYVGQKYVEPARERGESEFEVVAGDVHRALGYSNRYPLVCSALGSQKSEDAYRLRRIAVEGPLNGVTTRFRFQPLA